MKITGLIKMGAGSETRLGRIGSSFQLQLADGKTYSVFLGFSKTPALLSGVCSNYRDLLDRVLSEAALLELLQEYWATTLEEGVEDLYDL